MRELDALISEYSHEKHRPRESEALFTLRKIASLVKPIMRARSWRVGTLAEFYPAERSLLGVNWNKGQKICLRLRYPGDANQFLPIEQVVDTMLHELSHNVFNEHDANFHALWNQLREEYEGLVRKGYTGEGFLSDGKRLGGRRIPMDEARRLARVAAEKRRSLYAGSGQKLGGAGMPLGADPRRIIADAIERRTTVLKGCGSGRKDQTEIKAIADEATNTGFTTKAEEEEANDRAIAQALWELVQEEEKEKYGDSYVPPSAQNPVGNGSRNLTPATPSVSTATKSGNNRPASRLVPPPPLPLHSKPSRAQPSTVPSQPQNTNNLPVLKRPRTDSPSPAATSVRTDSPVMSNIWECEFCTCHNSMTFLCCDACGTERPAALSRKFAEASRTSLPVNLGKMSTNSKKTWTCHRCTTEMEQKWWSCSTCGAVKLSS